MIRLIAEKKPEFPCELHNAHFPGEWVPAKCWNDLPWADKWRPLPTAPEATPGDAKEFHRPPVGAWVKLTGHEEPLLVTAHTKRGFAYSGAIPLSIPRMGIQGDGTGEAFLDVAGVDWSAAKVTPAHPTSAALAADWIQAAEREINGVICAGMLGAKTPAGTIAAIIQSHFPAHAREDGEMLDFHIAHMAKSGVKFTREDIRTALRSARSGKEGA